MLHCKDGSDEQECRLVVPSVGYNKFLPPPPMAGDKYLYLNVSYDIRHILYIDEAENFIRITYNLQKDWYDSLLSYQNLKKNSINLIFQEDKKLIWTPWINSDNMESIDKERRSSDVEILKVVPNDIFKFKHNLKTSFHNALLFKVQNIKFFTVNQYPQPIYSGIGELPFTKQYMDIRLHLQL